MRLKDTLLEYLPLETSLINCSYLHKDGSHFSDTREIAIASISLHKYSISSKTMSESTIRCAVVTGSNSGIGLATVKLLASNGIRVVLTSLEEEAGLQVMSGLKDSHLSALILFHQLDVTDAASIASLVEFLNTEFGKLDILVNNAGIAGFIKDHKNEPIFDTSDGGEQYVNHLKKTSIETYQLAQECVQTNYYGAKRMVEALIPLLKLSDSPRIVNVSSTMGMLENFPGEEGRAILSNIETLTEEKIDHLLDAFLKDFKENSLESRGWPTYFSAYTVSKISLTAYTRILAKKYPDICTNCLCPGFAKTDINSGVGFITPEEAAITPVKLALLPSGSSSGLFYRNGEVSSF